MMQDNQIDQNVDLIFTKEDAYLTLEMINTWISNIDTKVSFALAFSGVLIGSVFSTGLPNALKRISEVSKLKELNGGEIIGAILVCILYVISFMSILYFMLAIIARIKNPNNPQSVFFFGSIATMKLLEYKTKVNSMSQQEILEDLEEQIHINSMICNKKVKYYNIGIRFLVATIILWFICMAFTLI
ncbi:hypothetical protein KQH90_10420 [Anaerosalibacter bizertensis]|uniref:Pycsar system effector family protein n=1 Tax=Anaerosalibacter bizertensis TaxID=932217 RepID=UPI001C0EF48B|nr:Pycsar system effector family protein [Anaerosalibacter bizertensis]MBU5294443.1 hypothetical protein [Anaerosalibacter bizertensis]